MNYKKVFPQKKIKNAKSKDMRIVFSFILLQITNLMDSKTIIILSSIAGQTSRLLHNPQDDLYDHTYPYIA